MSASSRRSARNVVGSAEESTWPRHLRVGIVGAGRVGAVLGAALNEAGHRVVTASGFSPASVARIERLLPDAALLPPDRVPLGVQLVLLAVPDDALAGLAYGLVEAG